MFVTNHVLSGVLIGRALEGRPVTAFLAGVGSHLAVDLVPHWGCVQLPGAYSEQFLRAARRDGVLGLATMAAAAVAVDRRARPAVLAAMAGAALLDLDKPCTFFLGFDPFPRPVQRIHRWVQRESPTGMRNEVTFGAAFAALDAVAAVRSRRVVETAVVAVA